jgi:hypothetical protein
MRNSLEISHEAMLALSRVAVEAAAGNHKRLRCLPAYA